MNIVDSPPKLNVSIPSPMKMIMKQKTKKLANNHNGISSKLFDFTNIEHAPNPNPNPNPNSNSNHNPINISELIFDLDQIGNFDDFEIVK